MSFVKVSGLQFQLIWARPMLEIKSLSLSRGRRVLLNQASARVEPLERMALVGRNGAGKSSLFQLILGHLKEDTGEMSLAIEPGAIAHLEQSLPTEKTSVHHYVMSGDVQWAAADQAIKVAEAQGDGMAIAQAHIDFADIDGYQVPTKAAKICQGLGFQDAQLDQCISEFSGGWQMRMQLARVLMSRAQLLLLDEPTNHLDIESIVWLEDWLCSQPKTLLIISHDRDFMDHVCNRVMYLHHQTLEVFKGNYTQFARAYDLKCQLESQTRDALLKKRAHLQKFVDRFRAKASKAKQAQSRVKALEKMQVGEALQKESPFHFQFFTPKKSASPAISAYGDMGYGEHRVLTGVDVSLVEGGRIGLLGKNGQGKSTLIKSLCGDIPLLSGEVTIHPSVVIAHFCQQGLDTMDGSATPMNLMHRLDAGLSEQATRQYLGQFNFSNERVFESIANFSGGERARLHLAMLIYSRPNVLLLDEPTNHLDMPMREALSVALQSFEGTLVVVSHDRHFLSSTVDEFWCIHRGRCERYIGDIDQYSDYILNADKHERDEEVTPVAVSTKAIKHLEKQIQKVSEKIDSIDKQLSDPSLYTPESTEQLKILNEERSQQKQALEDLESRWMQAQEGH